MGFISSLFGRGKNDRNPKVDISSPSGDAAEKANHPEKVVAIPKPEPVVDYPVETREWQIGDRIEGRWEVHQILRGGMGILYVVYDHESKEVHAAKTFPDKVFATRPQIAERFQREASAWMKLDIHQNVTRARFVEVLRGKPFLFLSM